MIGIGPSAPPDLITGGGGSDLTSYEPSRYATRLDSIMLGAG